LSNSWLLRLKATPLFFFRPLENGKLFNQIGISRETVVAIKNEPKKISISLVLKW
jgi:DNA-binding Xre family transcriptional regulator